MSGERHFSDSEFDPCNLREGTTDEPILQREVLDVASDVSQI